MRPTSTDPAPIALKLRRALELHHGTVDDLAREAIRLLGVNATDRRALEIVLLANEEPTTPGMLADQLGLTAGGTTIMLNRLEKHGYIVRSLHPTDRRRVIVVATDLAARRVRRLIAPLLEEAYTMMVSGYEPAELEMIASFLGRVSELQRGHRVRLREMGPYPPPLPPDS
ncbi:MarR family transcriptional regulator [Nocardia sp. NPDC050712]|uniref:MarR family winged helix-turn-helix transcriptional regulator n=1 Tax=Nocardia sp. NPDC050712 TaxID=3155518 RepID=UPI0033EE87A2